METYVWKRWWCIYYIYIYIYSCGRTKTIAFLLFRKQVSFLILWFLLTGLMERKKKQEKLFNIYDIPLISFSCAMTAAAGSIEAFQKSIAAFFHLSSIVIRSRCLIPLSFLLTLIYTVFTDINSECAQKQFTIHYYFVALPSSFLARW